MRGGNWKDKLKILYRAGRPAGKILSSRHSTFGPPGGGLISTFLERYSTDACGRSPVKGWQRGREWVSKLEFKRAYSPTTKSYHNGFEHETPSTEPRLWVGPCP
jgi:hypothetical protein